MQENNFNNLVDNRPMRVKLLDMTTEEIKEFIRERLAFDKSLLKHFRTIDAYQVKAIEHYRFDMSGYGDGDNDCYFENLEILKKFADCGIWDYVAYLYLDAYKGTMTLYWGWWENSTPKNTKKMYLAFNTTEDTYSGMGTVDIIHDIIMKLYVIPTKQGWTPRRFY